MTGSLRGRLLLHLGLAVALSTALTVGVAAFLVRHNQQVQVQRTLDRQAEALRSVLPAGLSGVYAISANRVGLRALAPARARRVLAAVPAGGDHDGQITFSGAHLRFSERSGVVLVRPSQLGRGDPAPFLLSLVLAGLASAAVAAALAFALARRLVRPINALAEAARELPGRSTPAAVPVQGARELAELGAAFNGMSRELIAAREAERTFLLSVSHELKTPLTAIQGYAEGLQDGAVQPREAGDVIAAETSRLERLVRDLLDLGRLQRHEFTVAIEPVDLAAVVESARARFEPLAAERQVRLETLIEGAVPALGDPGRLLQVASNLLENALRITPAGGEVTIAAAGATLSVSDTGPGLSAADLPHAFERFYLHERRRKGGSGLGLAIVGELAAVMGGSASVVNIPGSGARFSVALRPAGDSNSPAQGR